MPLSKAVSSFILAAKPITKIKFQQNPGGEILALIRKERDYIPKELHELASVSHRDQGSSPGVRF